MSSHPAGPAAEHDQPPWQVGRAQALRGGPGRYVGKPLDRRRDRLASGRDDQVRVGQRDSASAWAATLATARGQRDLDRSRAGDPAGAADHRHARAVQPSGRGRVVQAAGHFIPPGHRVFPGRPAGRGKQQRVRRQAGQVRRLASDQSRLDERHRLAAAGHLGGDVHASGAAAEHDHIESAHISPSPSNFEPWPGLAPKSPKEPKEPLGAGPGTLIIAATAKLASRVGRNPPMLARKVLEYTLDIENYDNTA